MDGQSQGLFSQRWVRLPWCPSGYIDYNVVAKKLDRRLAGLGATELIPRGLGDDQHSLGYEAALDPWLAALWNHLRLVSPIFPYPYP